MRALAHLLTLLPEEQRRRVQLVVAGGYDPRVQENVEHHEELRALAEVSKHSTCTTPPPPARSWTNRDHYHAHTHAHAHRTHHIHHLPRSSGCVSVVTQKLGVAAHVRFIRSFSDDEKAKLIEGCRAILYTPANEHFGIVPLEVCGVHT